MGTVHQLRRREIGQVLWRSAVLLGIGDNDLIEAVVETDHDSEQAARAWVEQRLPTAELPEWVSRRPHGTAGAFLFGQIEQGYYTGPSDGDWEPGLDDRCWDADLVDGVIRWRIRD